MPHLAPILLVAWLEHDMDSNPLLGSLRSLPILAFVVGYGVLLLSASSSLWDVCGLLLAGRAYLACCVFSLGFGSFLLDVGAFLWHSGCFLLGADSFLWVVGSCLLGGLPFYGSGSPFFLVLSLSSGVPILPWRRCPHSSRTFSCSFWCLFLSLGLPQ